MDDKELSADDLREKLFHTFQSRGVLESLKSQLRNRLVNELQQTAKANLANGKKKIPEEPLLFYHAANSLVVDHLEKCNFDYTLSVFLPECGTSRDKIYTVKDLLHLLKVDQDSQLYKSLETCLSTKINSKSFLWEIVSQFSSMCGHNKQNSAVQTDDCHSIKSPSVAEKLKFVDKTFFGQAERGNETWSLQSEQKIMNFQKKCEERKKAELSAEVQRFRASELSRIRLEEKEQCQKAIKLAKEQMEKDYSLKAETLRLKEKELEERENRYKKIQEQEAYDQRQKILEDMQAIKDRESDLKRKQELQERSLKLEEEKIKVDAEKLKEKEMGLREQESRMQQKIEDEIQRYKLQHQEHHQKKLHDLELREVQFQQEKQNFDNVKEQYKGYYSELEEKKEQLRKHQSQLEASKYNIANLQQQKDALLHKLDEVKDYSTIRKNENALQLEKAELQRLLEDERSKEKAYKTTIKELKDKNSKPSADLVSVRNELKTFKEDAQNKDKLSKERQKKLEVRLQQENHRCKEFQRLYEEGLLKQKEMERESEDLRAALHHTQTLLRMELERRRFSEASVSDVSLSSPPPEPSPNTVEYVARPRQNSDRNGAEMNDTKTTQELIANSKEVFDKLEKDAKDLEESYRRFQSRMKNTGLDQFTSVPPVSLEKQPTLPEPHTVGAQPLLVVDSKQDKANSQDNFVPLSWVPASENKGHHVPIPYLASGHVSSSVDPQQFTQSVLLRDDTTNGGSGTRFYSLPSFGVSDLTQNTPAPRYFGLSAINKRPANNTVNVSDLIAKPGSPSVISAPIDHSSIPSTITDTSKPYKNTGYSSAEMTRRPLSSTIGRGDEGTGMSSRETGFLTSSDVQKGSAQASHVPVIDGSVFHGRKSDTESENESHRSSDASLSAGYLSLGTLNKPDRTLDGKQRKKQVDTPQPDNQENTKSDSTGGISLDAAWGGTADYGNNERQQSLGGESVNSDHSSPEQAQRPPITLDSAWKNNSKGVSTDNNFAASKEGDLLHEKSKLEELNQSREHEERERQDRERKEREIRELELERNRQLEQREWEEEQRKREELRRQREEEAWEREQRELAELQRKQELQERENAKQGVKEESTARRDVLQEDKAETEQEEEDDKKDPDIDPVMLQYMQMIQAKREEEQKAKTAESTKQGKSAKDAADTPSNSILSQGAEEGSLDDFSGDDGFDWG